MCSVEHLKHTDVNTLRTATALIHSVRGDSNQPAREWLAFRNFYMVGPLAKSSIKELLKKATPAGKLYAAILLRHLNKKEGAKVLQRMSKSKEKVEYAFECQAEFTTVGALAKRILRGEQLVKIPSLAEQG